MTDRLRTSTGLHLVFLISGISSLGSQLVWMRLFALGLGQETPALIGVLTAYFVGFGLGAWRLARCTGRSPDPTRWYAGLELVAGAWTLVSIGLIPAASRHVGHWLGVGASPDAYWLVATTLPFVALAPASLATGALLPAMDRLVSAYFPEGRRVGGLYAAGTAGATLGAIFGSVLLARPLGLAGSLVCFAALRGLCALLAVIVARSPGRASPEAARSARPVEPGPRRIRTTLLAAGALGIGYEILAIRLLGQVLDSTIYTYTALLTVYLSGTATGAAIQTRFFHRSSWERQLRWLFSGLSASCLLGIGALLWSAEFRASLPALLGGGLAAVSATELLIALGVFGLPAACMGATFSVLVQAARDRQGEVGAAVAVNAAGCALAPGLFGVALLPLAGSTWTMVLVSIGYACLIPRPRLAHGALPVAGLAVALLLPRQLRLALPPREAGQREVFYREGPAGTVAVFRSTDGRRTLRVDGRLIMGGTGATRAERRHSHIPLLLHAHPRRALFLGLGTGISFGAMTAYADLTADGVELLPEVVEALPWFEPENQLDSWPGKLTVQVADARRFVQSNAAAYDVVVGDLFHPARDGAAALYTVEHFRAVGARLAPGGLFCQWLPLYQLNDRSLGLIVRSFLAAFPRAEAWILRPNIETPVLGLIAGRTADARNRDDYRRALAQVSLADELRFAGLDSELHLFGLWLGGPAWLSRFAGSGPLNQDLRPLLAFEAPRSPAPPNGTASRLRRLLENGDPEFAQVLGDASADPELVRQLGPYRSATIAYLEGLELETADNPDAATDAYARSAELSPHFTLGYARCLQLAAESSLRDPQAAAALLRRLARAQPERAAAGRLLERLSRSTETTEPGNPP